MADTYLNRGEMIILTTPRISVGSAIFDMMLTTRRIILVDNRYARFEPQMIPFSTILTVKGGKIPTGEPVISISCSDADRPDESTVTNLIFSQQPAEQRKQERDLWVKKIIELVVSARQNGIDSDSLPADQDTGMRPSVRRWIAPDHLRPHSSVIKPPPEVTEVVVTQDDPDVSSSLDDTDFSSGITAVEQPEMIEARTAAKEQTRGSESSGDTGEDVQKSPVAGEEDSEKRGKDHSQATGEPSGSPIGVPESSAGPTPAESPGDGSDRVPWSQTVSQTSLAETILLAAKSLTSHEDKKETQDKTMVSTPADMESPAPVNPELSEDWRSIKPTGDELLQEIILPPSPEVPDSPSGFQEMVTPTGAQTHKGEDSDALMETPDVETGVKVPAEPPEPKSNVRDRIPVAHPVKLPFKRLPGTVGALVVIGVILILGGVFFSSLFQSGTTSNLHKPEITPVATVQVTPSIAPLTIPSTGFWIRVVYPGTFIGTVGNPGYLFQVSGSGDKFYKTLRSDGLIQATVRKQDYSGDTLAVEVYANGSMIAHRTVATPMGEINLLIDAHGNLPGVSSTSNLTSQTGNTRLVYL